MCAPHATLARITLVLDAAANVCAATVTHHWDSDHESHQPITVGPFDTPCEALNRAVAALTVQPSLWDDAL